MGHRTAAMGEMGIKMSIEELTDDRNTNTDYYYPEGPKKNERKHERSPPTRLESITIIAEPNNFQPFKCFPFFIQT